MQVEKELVEVENANAVLVSVQSLTELRRAYPNYFLDVRRFVEDLDRVIF